MHKVIVYGMLRVGAGECGGVGGLGVGVRAGGR